MKTIHLAAAIFLLSATVLSPVFSEDYDLLDRHALAASESLKNSIDDLVKYLIKPAKNDAGKARVIYVWITKNVAYDTESYFSGVRKDNTAENVLKAGMSVCEGYANLFCRMSDLAGIECIKISGWSKGYGYKSGQSFGGKTDHSWNAVKIEGKWMLIDSTWGAGFVDKSGKFVFKYTDYYFLTPPEQFILTHYPQDPEYQYLDKKVSLKEFEKSYKPYRDFFKYNLVIDDFKNAEINASDSLMIPVKTPEEVILMAKLKADETEINNATLLQYKDGIYEIYINFPDTGTYTLHIYVKGLKEKGDYPEAVKYLINARKKNASLFPATYENFRKTRCYLHSPLTLDLNEGGNYVFKARIPEAVEAVIIQGKNEWIPMKKNNDEFELSVKVKSGTVKMSAKFPGRGDTYWTIAQYECGGKVK